MAFHFEQDSYQALRGIVAEHTSPIVIWCGAGLSAPAGMPTWSALRAKLGHALVEKAETLDDAGKRKLLSHADAARKSESIWTAFQILATSLGFTSYQAVIREALTPLDKADTPESYVLLWTYPIRGLINLNIDRLATRALTATRPGIAPVEFSSINVGQHTGILSQPKTPFIFNAHGVIEDSTSWVFTDRELSSLLRNERYQMFIKSVLATSTVILLGITADDLAVGGHLQELKKGRTLTGAHYWFTDRRDLQTDRWAEHVGIRPIRYRAKGGDHSELHEALRDLFNFIPEEEPTPDTPIILTNRAVATTTDLPAPAKLATYSPEQIRQIMNARARDILAPETSEALEQYLAFCDQYALSMYVAWYTSLADDQNILLGYTLIEEAEQGAFGKVFKAVDDLGNFYAIKVLHQGIRTNRSLLAAFRRGVRSMIILKERGVAGVVKYHEAYEIPALVVMDWIDGRNLKEMVSAKQIENWIDILEIADKLATILRSAHAVPERVLHRDLRPTNVMVSGYERVGERIVVVLDFDLSWHKGAYDVSVVHGSTAAGYLAPEQIESIPNVSTRHSAVDSFGFGMVVFFLLSGRDPLADEQRHKNWEESVLMAAERRRCNEWKSLQRRISRLVISATCERQHERWDLSQIGREVSRLRGVLESPDNVTAGDLLVEEIAARSDAFRGYAWIEDKLTAMIDNGTGTTLQLTADESAREVVFTLQRTQTGSDDRSKFRTLAESKAVTLTQKLRSCGWKSEVISKDSIVKIQGRLGLNLIQDRVAAVAEDISQIAVLLN